jgi:quinol monooxygenase YgiN
MIVEYIRYKIADVARQAELIAAYEAAQASLLASPHCLGYELARCSEEPAHFILRIEWDSHDGHLKGFRQSAAFQPFLAAVRPFVGDIEEMRTTK